jgi:EpsI family protein
MPGSRQARILTLVLAVQALVFYASSRSEAATNARPLREFPLRIGPWETVREGYVDEETNAVLRADDTVTRYYADFARRRSAGLFAAYWKTQRTGQKPHSPQNCLPGAGWELSRKGRLSLAVDGEPAPIDINKFLVIHGEERSVILYWYQTPQRVIASEYAAMAWLIADSMRFHRTDTALVRVNIPIAGGDEQAAVHTGSDFVRAIYPSIKKQLWP